MTVEQITRKLQAIEITIAGELSNANFLALCERYDDLSEQLTNLNHGVNQTHEFGLIS